MPADPASLRLFFALWPDAAAAARLASVATAAARRDGGKPARSDTLHLTLAFVGDVPATHVDPLIDHARGVCHQDFELTLDRLAYWRHNRLLWAGCSSPPAALVELASDLRATLQRAGHAVADGGGHAFVPHVTLVRRTAAGDPGELAPVGWHCHDFVLVASMRSAAGAAYRRLASFPLCSKNA